mgnify:CR=1 FL=1
MTLASPKECALAYVVSLLALGLVLSPLLRHPDEDSFPLSTFPMFSHERPRRMTVMHAVGVDAAGERTPLSPRVSAATSEPLQSLRTLELAVQAGRGAALCAAIAARVAAEDDLVDQQTVEVETIAFDAVAYFDEDPPGPYIRRLHARCPVPR